MNKKTVETDKTSRRSFTKSAITALALTPIISLETRANDAQEVEERQSSPITVGGGGSVGIDFNRQRFSEGFNAKLGTKLFSRDQDSLHKLWLIDKYGALENITPDHADCLVTIHCQKGSKARAITITGKPLSLAFDKVEFEDGIPEDGKKSIHHNKDYKIVNIEVYDKAATPQTKNHKPPTKGKCTIVVVNSL